MSDLTPQDLLDFLARIVHGEPIESLDAPGVPTFEQRLKTVLALLGKPEFMAQQQHNDPIYTPETVAALRNEILEQLARLRAEQPPAPVSGEPESGGAASPQI
ncbi:MAG: hypothetical protein LW855_02455 [Alphaproteobacteria bacterium]|nr:hypothetical protein [Alphaproteobacteria bacterium]